MNRKLWSTQREAIETFYQSPKISVLLPDKRKKKKEMPFYEMQVSLLAAYKEFRLENPQIKFGVFTFQKARPKCIHLLKRMKWLQCVCDICANIKYICTALHSSLMRDWLESPGWLPVSEPITIGLETICHGAEKLSAKCLARKCGGCGTKEIVNDLICGKVVVRTSCNGKSGIKESKWSRESRRTG